ncbi:MAG: acyl-CoA thioesterase [Clostridiales bacterium]|nr:acyl-CoA thioesterase [Clostridiales bacterium]
MEEIRYQGYEHRVQYYETDQMACVHHSNYIRWFEEIRTDFMEFLGMGYDVMEAAGILSPVLTMEAEYKSMTRYGETVEIGIRIKEYNGIRIRLVYEVTDKETKTLRCRGESSHCFITREGKPVSLKRNYPDWDARLRREMEQEEEK